MCVYKSNGHPFKAEILVPVGLVFQWRSAQAALPLLPKSRIQGIFKEKADFYHYDGCILVKLYIMILFSTQFKRT